MSERIETQIYRPDPDRPGYLQLVRDRTVGEVYDDLRAAVGEYPDGGEEYLTAMVPRPAPWPRGRLAVFSVNGSSEGDYVHVEVHPEGTAERTCVLLAKTFEGRDASWAFARVVADLLEER